MKKQFGRVLAFCVVSSLFVLTSCKNFLNNGSFLDELEEQLAYVNAPSFTVTIAVEDKNSGDVLSAPVREGCKVSDSIHLDFSLTEGYNFICWQAVQKSDTATVLNDFVEFKNNKDLTTTVTIKEANEAILNSDLLIRPIAVPFCSLTDNCKPANTNSGVARDSAIYLELTNKLSDSNDLSEIKLEIDGETETWGTHFETPVFFEKDQTAISIAAITSNRIEVPANSTKSIKVTIPSTFTYETGASTEELGSKLVYEYKINSSTSEKILVQLGVSEEDSGTIKINKQSSSNITVSLSIGEEIDVVFKMNEGYKFHGFSKSDKTAVEFSCPTELDGYEENGNYGYNPTTKTYAVHVKALSYVQNLAITAETTPIKERSIKIASGYGKITPNITKNYFEETEIPLSFSPDAAYAFINWTVKLGDEDVTDKNYITFGNKDSEDTTATFNLSPEDEEKQLSIEPYCLPRPLIVQTYPMMQEAGSYRDSNIQITFDQNMDPDSIYFDPYDAEFASLTKTSDRSKDNALYYKEFTINNTETEKRYYAYKKNGELHYKNITVTDSIEGNSILSYYDCPYFETPDTLIIPVIRKTGGELSGPSADTKVAVTISNNFYYTAANKQIRLSLPTKWVFTLNDKNDTTKPTLTMTSFTRGKNSFDSAVGETVTISTSVPTMTTNWIKGNFVKDYIEINASVNDNESFPSDSIVMNLYKIKDYTYKDVTSATPTYTKSISISGPNNTKKVNRRIYLSELLDTTKPETSGIYKVVITAYNNVGLTANSSAYYILVDHTGPVMPADYKSLFTTKNGYLYANKYYQAKDSDITFTVNTNLTSNISDNKDLLKKVVYNGQTFNNTTSSNYTVTATGLSKNSEYPFTITMSDIFGNESTKTYTLYSQPTEPGSFTTYMYGNSYGDTANVHFKCEESNSRISKLELFEASQENGAFTLVNISISKNCDVPTDQPKEQKKYYYLKLTDTHGNESAPNYNHCVTTYPHDGDKYKLDIYIDDNNTDWYLKMAPVNGTWADHPLITNAEVTIKTTDGKTETYTLLKSNNFETKLKTTIVGKEVNYLKYYVTIDSLEGKITTPLSSSNTFSISSATIPAFKFYTRLISGKYYTFWKGCKYHYKTYYSYDNNTYTEIPTAPDENYWCKQQENYSQAIPSPSNENKPFSFYYYVVTKPANTVFITSGKQYEKSSDYSDTSSLPWGKNN